MPGSGHLTQVGEGPWVGDTSEWCHEKQTLWPRWPRRDPGGSSLRCPVGWVSVACHLLQTCPPFSPARMAPMLPTVTLHPPPRLGTENGCAGGRKRQEQRVLGGTWGPKGVVGAFPLYCFPHSEEWHRAGQGGLLTPGRGVPGAWSPSLPGRGQGSPPWALRDKCHPSMA